MVTLRNQKHVEPNEAAGSGAPQKHKAPAAEEREAPGDQTSVKAKKTKHKANHGTSAGNDMPQKRKAAATEEREAPEAQTSVKAKKLKHEADHNTCTATPNASNETKRTQTPPPTSDTQQQRTPGRVGPVKKDCNCKPDIKPFKGEPGHKVRKSASEKEQEYTDFVMKHEGHTFHELHVCYAKGPNGSPTYDKSGFELDYEKVAEWMKPVTRKQLKASVNSKGFLQSIEEDKKKYKMFFGDTYDGECSPLVLDVARDKISKTFGIPYHKVGMAEFEEWERRGFPKENYEEVAALITPGSEIMKRMMRLATGSALRK
jgi:hypothetical protein